MTKPATMADVVHTLAMVFEEQERNRPYSSMTGPRVPDLDARLAALRALASQLEGARDGE